MLSARCTSPSSRRTASGETLTFTLTRSGDTRNPVSLRVAQGYKGAPDMEPTACTCLETRAVHKESGRDSSDGSGLF